MLQILLNPVHSTRFYTLHRKHSTMKFPSNLLLLIASAAGLYIQPSSPTAALALPSTAVLWRTTELATSPQTALPSASIHSANQSLFPSQTNETQILTATCSSPSTNIWNPSIDSLIAIFFGVVSAILQLNHIQATRSAFTRKIA